MLRFAYVKLFLSLSLTLFQTEIFAQSKCEYIFKSGAVSLSNTNPKNGAQILHEKDSKLHTSKAVEKAVAKHKESTNQTVTKPADKLNLWLDSLSKIAKKADSSHRTLDQIKTILQNQYVIKQEEVPQSYYDLQIRLAKERGHGEITINDAQKRQLAENIIKDQKHSLDTWIEYLVSKDTSMYPMWLKLWMFTGMTKLSKYNAQTGQFGNRDKGTVAPFAELNREALGLVADYVLKYLDKKSLDDIQDPEFAKLLTQLQFGKLYGHLLKKLNVGNEGTFKTNEGKWVVFKKGSDHMPLVKSLEGRNTGWCTAGESTAKEQLAEGDFHVYYSLDENGALAIPRVAIRMENDDIAEVRGVAANQNLDPQINQSPVVTSKMKEFGKKAEKFQKRDRDMKLLTQIETKHHAKIQLTKEEIKFLWEIEQKIDGFGYQKDPRIDKIRSLRNFKLDIAELYDHKYKLEEITTTEEEFFAANGKSMVHVGNLILFKLTSADGLVLPEIILGDLELTRLTTAENLVFPRTVRNLVLNKLISAKNLTFPETVRVIDLRSLNSAQGLVLPKKLENLFLNSLTTIQGLTLPDTVQGLFLNNLNSAQGLLLPQNITHLGLTKLISTQGLILPETLIYLDISGLPSTKGLKLPKGVTEYYGPKDINR